MGKPASLSQKIAFLVHCEYVAVVHAAKKAGIPQTTANDIKRRADALKAECEAQGWPPPSYQEQIERKVGSGAKPKTSVEEVSKLLDACTLNRRQRKKLWHVVAKEEGFFDYHRRTIEKKLRERGLRRAKSTKKLSLTDIQKAQRYELALSRKDWAECRATFDAQERAKEAEWDRKGQRWPAKRASWEVYWKNHKYKRDAQSRGGVDNIRYINEVLKPKLIPFWEELMVQRHEPDLFEDEMLPYVFQQDNAPSHASKWTQRILKQAGIPLYEHIGNSADQNAIEGVWMPMRIEITKQWDAPHTIEWTDRA
ncbi:hypothetical protein BKA61DRAFT_662537 [Leptodontidium sp. MPI-SDFR-AT-0119]|nr:hypothetical protein BKA61DRAFT_662537 [Leptodontidium sp. MPI-SDFR-AT-0119]